MENNHPTNNAPSAKGAGIWAKLFQIQKKFQNFGLSEDSDKQDPKTGKSAYRYTPGWKITEAIRREMDALGLMLVPDITLNEAPLIEYPVYKVIGGTPMSLVKKEIHCIVTAAFTWVDTATGEKAGPFHIPAAGANGTDKSTASALALAERYFFLKFFHIATRDTDEEPDAHDSDFVPGIPKSMQAPAKDADACRATPVGTNAPFGGYQAPAAPHQPMPYPAYPPQQPRQGIPQAGQQVNVFTGAPVYQPPVAPQPGTAQGFDENNVLIQQAIARLANFDRSTDSFQQELNQVVGILAANGVFCTEPNFIAKLSEAAQARREGRIPQYK